MLEEGVQVVEAMFADEQPTFEGQDELNGSHSLESAVFLAGGARTTELRPSEPDTDFIPDNVETGTALSASSAG
ncbi:hypothetical protein [Halococcus agarilyticus]|uniref:hypothetical protein n=1 Tax=Halococcus agarilyticus TaxID=1232219 RepID=UPI000677BE65|nr:hypothetical protein [Halococcus agarilyticus]